MKENLITVEEIQDYLPYFKSKTGKILLRVAMSLFGVNRANALYKKFNHYEGTEFCREVLNDLGVILKVKNDEILEQFRQDNFVTISNHPYGHLDGISLIYIFAQKRSDFKVTANFILGLVEPLAMNFMEVNPYRRNNGYSSSVLKNAKDCLNHITSGHPMGFFPAGAISFPKIRKGKFIVEDRDWKTSTIKLIKKANVPVIPVYFSGHNSPIFNFLGMFSWKLRSIRLPHELFNKKGKIIEMIIGNPILPDEINSYKNPRELAVFLKKKVYGTGLNQK